MQHLGNSDILCLTHAELVPSIMTVDVYDKSKARGNITVHGRGGNGREVLVEYESLPHKYKNLVKQKYGNPYDYFKKQPILERIEPDEKALDFFTAYPLPNGLNLPEEYVLRYTTAASWMNTIVELTTNKRALKETMNVSVMDFWEIITSLIQTKNVHLPTSRLRLTEKLRKYKAEGYGCLVEAWRFGNENSKKVKDEVAEALLLELIAHPHQHDDTIIAAKYNEWAGANGREQITPGAVTYRRQKSGHLVTQGREGKSANYNKYSKRILRDRASAPLLFINSDDNILDLYFRDQKNPYYRPALYVVADTFNDYILGYAIGDTVTIDLVKAAYRNAMRHVMELTGGAYLWHQLQTDRWGLDVKLEGELATWFKMQGHFTPATAKVAQGKYIERSFGTTWHQNLKMFPNYSGYNITAKERLNPDSIARNKSDYPAKEHAPQVVAGFIRMMRESINPKSGKSRQAEWLEAFHASDKSRKKHIGEAVRLQIFGVQHPYSNRLEPEGLKVTLDRQKRVYDIPSELYLENVGKKVQVVYDPYDLSQVLVTDGKGLRFLAKEYEKMPAALADFEEGDRVRLNTLIEEKKQIMARIGDATQQRADILKRANVDAQSLLQAGVKTKEIRHQAEKTLTGSIHLPEETDSNHIWQLM